MQAAQVRADEMAASGIYSHTRPDGRKSNTVTDSRYTGENIHSISDLYLEQQHKTLSETVVNLWSNSKAHTDNMTNSRYGEIGGLRRQRHGRRWTRPRRAGKSRRHGIHRIFVAQGDNRRAF